jgi:hypothetical protein
VTDWTPDGRRNVGKPIMRWKDMGKQKAIEATGHKAK